RLAGRTQHLRVEGLGLRDVVEHAQGADDVVRLGDRPLHEVAQLEMGAILKALAYGTRARHVDHLLRKVDTMNTARARLDGREGVDAGSRADIQHGGITEPANLVDQRLRPQIDPLTEDSVRRSLEE